MNTQEKIAATGNCFKSPPAPKKKRKPLRRVSQKRQGENRKYLKLREEFLRAHPWCQIWLKIHNKTEADVYMVYPNDSLGYVNETNSGENWCVVQVLSVPRSQDIHHVKRRIGKNFLDISTWLAASREQHQWCHDHPREARRLGLLA